MLDRLEQQAYYVITPKGESKQLEKGKTMGTHAMTIIKNREMTFDDNWQPNGSHDVEVARFYRHYDGYPSGHGDDIANSLLNAADTKPIETMWGFSEQLNNRNWCQHFFKELCKRDIDIEFIGHDDNCYCDYTYVVTGDYANYGGKINIDGATYLSRITVDVYAGSENDTKIFSGNADKFIDWISTVED